MRNKEGRVTHSSRVMIGGEGDGGGGHLMRASSTSVLYYKSISVNQSDAHEMDA